MHPDGPGRDGNGAKIVSQDVDVEHGGLLVRNLDRGHLNHKEKHHWCLWPMAMPVVFAA